MKLHTEEEILTNEKLQLFKLRSLFQKSRSEFQDVAESCPYFIYINTTDQLNCTFVNNAAADAFDFEPKDLYKNGVKFLHRLSRPELVDEYTVPVNLSFGKAFDSTRSLMFFQYFRYFGKMTWFPTTKIFLDHQQFLSICASIKNLGQVGKYLSNVLDESLIKRNGMQKLSLLTDRERQIMKLLANGFTSKAIADELHISKLTADTHRRNLLNKLETKSYADLFRLVQGYELLGLMT